MADNNPNKPDKQGDEKDQNLKKGQEGSERSFIQAEQGRDLPLERDRLLEQIERDNSDEENND